MNQTTYARGGAATDSDPPHRRTTDVLKAAVDWLVALTGGALLFVGVALLIFTDDPEALAYLLVGGLMLHADAGVTTRLRVARLEAQMCDERSAVSTR